jgi:hypothetical protein
LCSALDWIARLDSFDRIFDGIEKTLKLYPESGHIFGRRVVGTLIEHHVEAVSESWPNLKKLISETAPDSFRPALHLDLDKFADLLNSYPDLRDDVQGWLKDNGADGVSDGHIRLIEGDTETS